MNRNYGFCLILMCSFLIYSELYAVDAVEWRAISNPPSPPSEFSLNIQPRWNYHSLNQLIATANVPAKTDLVGIFGGDCFFYDEPGQANSSELIGIEFIRDSKDHDSKFRIYSNTVVTLSGQKPSLSNRIENFKYTGVRVESMPEPLQTPKSWQYRDTVAFFPTRDNFNRITTDYQIFKFGSYLLLRGTVVYDERQDGDPVGLEVVRCIFRKDIQLPRLVVLSEFFS